jgi:hypothetical protein
MSAAMKSRVARFAIGLVALALLAVVFLSYFQADLMVHISEQIWACF